MSQSSLNRQRNPHSNKWLRGIGQLANLHLFEQQIANSSKRIRDPDAQDEEETILEELTHFRLLRCPNLQLDHLALTPLVNREYLPLRAT